ncbi:putative flap endonuclease-1-like 5' DNA nuclease [Stakelama sediminis]|uniref:Putative flap endonuclease-1-like 5' DNA nuclease n=2 Tax=Stakelama sediminis TaxID=463200 RepID=A0A840YVF5_9SPHN|nr:putative flap endonuclease-1-like 5' DNA nuclease [Stakelama sediminis]
MLFQTPTQFLLLALAIIAGWFFGLASHPGGRKWRDRYRTLEAEHKSYRLEQEAAIKERDARIREAEAERDRIARASPVAASTVTGRAVTEDRPANRGGWFGWGRDNLSRIRGIDEADEKALHTEGIKTYAAIEALSESDASALEERLGMARGRIANERWREQAAMLREGREEEHRRDYL